ncbi:hypothetical protein BGZ61DRAFT_507123 [Ilyonectria robusta]|uniref:uncharacterized protein n=1 Tax=Ilyonectria robusta TaxID=1079257 RepID=UPI001E8D9730|nr:uncharacterized protein BGZ61DRAFT_507123 [Ilyonectria robusta]KAH8686389.1 hypothetical protein BGZ61DRAFT_507123 [Ilyonectria robusta]
MPGTLIPPWYQSITPVCSDFVIVSLVWGISLGLSGFAVIRIADQTRNQYRRRKKVTSYMVFIWLELIASTVFGGVGWGYVTGTIPPSFEFFFGIIIIWIVQVHCIMQIIINRIALLAVSEVTVRRLRWTVFSILVLNNIAVSCIWIPARLQINQEWIHLNKIFDRSQKGIFLLIDAGLNSYFVYLVRSSLIAYGLKKYVFLYWFNIAMILLSVSMDILIIGMMFLPDNFVYIIFHPLAYLVKLHIELCMSDLIAKLVKSTGNQSTCDCSCHVDNPYFLGQDLDLANHTAPAVVQRGHYVRGRRRHIRNASWRRTMRFFSVQEARWQQDPEMQRGSVSTAGETLCSRRPAYTERSKSWAGPQPTRKDLGFCPSSFASMNRSNDYDEENQDQ